MCEKELQRFAMLTKLEKEITEIKKVVNQAYHRLNALEQECKEIRNQEEAEQQQQVEQEEEAEQQVTDHVCDFTCSSCSVTKPIDQRERERQKGKTKIKCL